MKYENNITPTMIKCPECETVQGAIVEMALPWGTFIHTCVGCKYLIMQSEWEEVKPFIQSLKTMNL